MIEWLKKNWKWIVFPVGLVMLLFSLFENKRLLRRPYINVDDELEAIKKANEHYRDELDTLHEYHSERLQQLSDEQKQELAELKNKSLTDVVRWFDRL